MNRLNSLTDRQSHPGRRAFLKTGAALGWLACLPANTAALAQPAVSMPANLKSFLESWRRPDGGYGFADMPTSHLVPAYAAVGCYRLFGERPPDSVRLANFIRDNHPFQIKKLEREMHVFEYQQILALQWLGENVDQLAMQVENWRGPTAYPKQYERDGNPVFQYEVMTILCRKQLGMDADEVPRELSKYVLSRRRPNGSFNNTPASDGSDGHVVNTQLGIDATGADDWPPALRSKAGEWLRACQRPAGGFTWQPDPIVAPIEDVSYTRAAMEALSALGESPRDRDACVDWVLSLRGSSSGFGPRPTWPSNLIATFDALATLKQLDALARVHDPQPVDKIARPAQKMSGSLKVFSVQIEAHGTGSPSEAVGLARDLKIDLWGAKNATPQWMAEAQQIADATDVPVQFFVANEEYGTWVGIPGLGTYSHTSDIQAAPHARIGESLAKQPPVTWNDFRHRRLGPLHAGGGTLMWQFNENELYTRLHLDDSIERGGYAAISTFHFGNPDFSNSEPFLMQYQGMIPYIALIDAHGPEAWWFGDQLSGMRTLFLAEQPTWEQFQVALKNNWVATVRHDAVSREQTWWHGGDPEATKRIQSRQDDFRWWGQRPRVVRPWASLVRLRAGDHFEAGSSKDVDLFRLRLRWDNTTQGQPKIQRVEMVRFLIDGEPVELTHDRIMRNGKIIDDHYLYRLSPNENPKSAVAELRWMDTGEQGQVIWNEA